MTAYRRLTALPLPASLLRTTRRLTSSRFSPSGKSLPSSPLVLTASRRLAPKLLLLLIGLAVLLALLPISSSVQAQTPANQPATGRPVVLASAEGAGILFADTEAIDDGNGLPIDTSNTFVIFNWTYQWIRVDGMTETNVGADSARYQPVEADVGKLIKVEVSFTDGDAYSETVTSLPFGPIVQPASTLSPSTLVSNTGQTPSSTANITQRYAMGFRLGDHGQGYEISSVSIDLAAAPSSLTVSLWSGGVPGALQPNSAYKLFDFANPSPFAAGLNEFTAPAGAFAYPNVNYFVVLSGFGSSLSINETTSDNEDAGGETGAVIYDDAAVRALSDTGYWAISDDRAGVLRMAVEGSRRTSGILASTYAQPLRDPSADQEIISVGDNISYGIELGAADRYLIRGVSWNMDDTDPDGSGFTNPYDLRSGSRTGAKQFTLVNSRKAPGLPVWTAPQGATVTGSGKYVLDQPVGEDTGPEKTRRRDAVLTRAAGAASKVVDGPAAAGVRFTGGIGDIALDNPLMALLGDPLYAMVQNLGQTGNSYASATATNAVLSQGFTTGPNATGYRLQGIGVNIEGSGSNFPDGPTSVSVAVHADSGGKPGSKLFDLLSPTEYAAGHSFFEAPPGTTLEASTSYVLVWSHLGGAEHRLHRTLSDNEDSGAVAGFSIANVFYRGADVNNLTANSTGNALEIAVYTDRDLSPPKRVTAFDLVSNNSTPRGVWGNDDTIWVANDGSGATDKLYAYNRSDGSRDSSSDFDNLNTAGNNDPRGICSDGTTMFVADSGDDDIYAYRMSDTTRISTREVSLASANNGPQGLSCDRTHLWVAEDNDDLTSKIFVYLRSDGSHVSTLDIGASTLNPSSTVGAINNNDQRGMWSNGTTLFVVDHGDTKVYGYQLSDRSRDDDKNLDLDAANTDPWGLWFDGRVLWVADTVDDKLYVYDLPGAQPGNEPADGLPEVRTPTTEQVWAATLTVGTNSSGNGYLTDFLPTAGSLTTTTFDLGGTTYTIRDIYDDEAALNDGGLVVIFDQEIPQPFNLSIGTGVYSSDVALPSTLGGAFWYTWEGANLSWSAGQTIAITMDVDAVPAAGVELRADTSGITDAPDGLDNVFYHYQWIRVDGTTVTELDGETGATYTATADDVTKNIQVRVIFDDAFRYREYPRYSPQVTVREVPPVVTSVTLTSNPGSDGIPDYAIGESVTATVTFDKAVDVTSGPQITLLFGTADKAADCAAATNTTTMECSYEVAANDTAPDGVAVKANTLALNGGTIYATGSTTNAATLTHSALGLQSGHVVDGIRPTLVTTGSDAPRTSGDGSEFILTFSENINIDDSKFKLFESTTALSTTAFTSLHNKLTIELTTAVLSSAGPLTVQLEADAVEDLVGNGILAVGSTTVLNQVSAAPSAPTNLMAEPAPDETPQLAVDLSWTAPTSDGGSAITSHQYRYNRNSGSFGSWTTIANSAAGGANATSFTVEGLSAVNNALTTFEFEVRAINDNGNGAESDPAATATIDVPDNISLSMATVGNRQVTLTWSTPNNNGSAILRYVYFVYDTVSATFVVPRNTTIPNSDADTTSFTITGLTNGVTYDVVIKAVNTVGSPDDDPGTYTPMAGPPGKPSVTVQSRVAALYVSWSLEDDGGSNITEYEVQWKSGAQGFDSSRQQAGLTGTNTRIENLINGTEYDVQVRAMNSAGWGEWSEIDSGTPVEGPAVSLSAETLTIDEGGSGAYSVVITTEPTAPVSILISPEGDVTTQPNALVFTASNWNIWQKVTVNAAQDGDADDDAVTIHHYTVTGTSAPEYASLTGLPSVQVTVLDDDVPPPAVRGFIAVDESQDAIALSWWSERGAAEYELEYRKQGDTGAWTPVTRGDFDHLPSTTGNRSLTGIATGLECETTYDFRIRLRGSGDILLDAFGPHTEVSRTTGECAQPNKPTNLMYTLDPDCATLTWTAPTGGDYTGVRIRRLTHGDPSFTVIHESLNSRPTSYRDCTHTGDGYGDGDSPEYAYAITYIKRETRSFDNNAESKVHRSGLKQYGPAVQDHLNATPRNVRLTRDTDSQRRMSWDAPPSWSLTTWAGLQGASVPVPDPWITGYVVERREFRARADGYLYFPEPEDTPIWSATMTVGSSTSGTPATGYFGLGSGAFGAMTQTTFTHSVGSGSWTVTSLSVTAAGLSLRIAEAPPLTENLPRSAFEDWVLVVDGRSFPFELPEGVVGLGTLNVSWPNSGLSWINGQRVSVQLVSRELFEWERLRRGRDGDTSTSFTDNEQANGRKFVYRIMTANTLGVSTNRAIFDWLFDSPYRDAVVDLAATDTTTDDGGAGDGETNTGNAGDGSANNAATGAPTISGTPQVGQTLTADTSAIDDADGLTSVSYEYQWMAGTSLIYGATGSTHTLTASEQGQTVQVRVSFTDDADNEETLTSEATETVAAKPNNAPTGLPGISGTPQVDQSLTADTSPIDDADGLTNATFEYQWIAGGSDIDGATGSSYTLTASEQGKTIEVRVTFTDDRNNAETLTSAATVEVAAAPAPLTASLADSRFQSARHKGADDRPQVIVAFSLPVASFEKTTPSVSLTGATVSSVRRHEEDGLQNAWIFFLAPDGNDDIVFSLVTGRPCDSGGICTEDGEILSLGVQVALPGPEEEEEEAGDDQQTPQSPPAKPTNLTATVNADGHIVLSWTAPDDDSITGYQVLRRRPSEGEDTLLVYVADTRSTATTFTDTGVTAGVKHVYRVKAINAAGLSGWSNYVNPTP